MVKVRVANPGPAALMVLNPRKRRSSMAGRRRKTTRRRARRSPFSLNPRRRRTRRATVRHSRSIARFSNPRRRGLRRRRRNPRSSSILAQGFAVAAGSALIQFTLGFIPPIGGVSPLADAGRTFAVGWLYNLGFSRIGPLRPYANDVLLAGAALAGGKIISSFILPFASRLFPTQAGQQSQAGMSGIAMMTGIPPAIAPPPMPPPVNNGVQGIGVIPGRWGR